MRVSLLEEIRNGRAQMRDDGQKRLMDLRVVFVSSYQAFVLKKKMSRQKHFFVLGNEEEIARTTGISLAIILFIIVPLSLISIIFLRQYYKTLKREQDEVEEEKRWNEIELKRLQQREVIEAARKERDDDYFVSEKDLQKDKEGEEMVERFIETPL